MRLDSINVDVSDPVAAADFWGARLQAPQLRADGDGIALALPGGLEFWFLRVPDARTADFTRASLLLAQDVSPHDRSVDALQDPDGHTIRVVAAEGHLHDAGPLLGVAFACPDPDAARTFWTTCTGWEPTTCAGMTALQHPSGTGPVLAFDRERSHRSGKSPIHLDLRLGAGEDESSALAHLLDVGASILDHGWGTLDWTVLTDVAGIEFCLLRPRDVAPAGA